MCHSASLGYSFFAISDFEFIFNVLMAYFIMIDDNNKGNITAPYYWPVVRGMGLLPDTYNCVLRMCREFRERLLHRRLQRKPLVSDPGMHHGMYVTSVSWCMSGSLTRGGGENVPGIPGACATRYFVYLARGPCTRDQRIPVTRDKEPESRFYVMMSSYHLMADSGPRLNIKTVFPWYGDSHVKDKTVGETVLSLTWGSLYW